MPGARIRLALLWLSQAARVLADNCLRLFVVLQIGQAALRPDAAAFHLVTAFFVAPFVVLAPLNGALSNSLPRRWVLAGASAGCLGVALLFGVLDGPWLVCMALTGIGAAVYSPTRYAVLPAAAQDTAIPLTRVNGWIEMGGSAGIVLGTLLGIALHGETWHGLPAAVAVAAAASLVSFLAALPVRFPSDVLRPEPPVSATIGFFRDVARVAGEPEARSTLLGLAYFLGMITAGAGAVLAYVQGLGLEDTRGTLMQAMLLISVGSAAGAMLAGVEGHPSRARGFVPLGVTGLLAVLAWAAIGAHLDWPCLLLGLCAGLVTVPLRAAYQAAVPADARGNGMAVLNTAIYVSSIGLALVLVALNRLGLVTTGAQQLIVLAVFAAAGAIVAWWALFRDTLELGLEVLFWPIYRIRAHGPGVASFPRRGPLLVIANHTAYVDPVWLAKVLPRRLTPMMTSDFYDLPGLHWLMTRVVHAIRVESSSYRREAPELDEAIAALDRGQCVLMFPEGWVRRRPEAVVRQFGQGVWHILARPETPIVACWLEGGWGSYTSYHGGPPTVNKRMDWWRTINVAIGDPQMLNAQLLEDQRATRAYLMQLCLDARRYLGLEPIRQPDPSVEEQNHRVTS